MTGVQKMGHSTERWWSGTINFKYINETNTSKKLTNDGMKLSGTANFKNIFTGTANFKNIFTGT